MTASFADAGEYRIRHDCDLSDARLQAALDAASRLVASKLREAGIDYTEPSEEFAADLEDVVIDVTRRALPDRSSGSDASVPFGVKQYSMGANGFSESWSMGNPYGDMFLRKDEKRRLGIPTTRIGFARQGRL